MESNKDRIQELKTNGYTISFEAVFNLAFENYKKIVVYAGLLFLVSAFLLGMLAFVTIAFTYGIENFQELIKPENLNPKNFSDEFLMAYIGSITLFSCLVNPFFAGIIKMAHCAETDEEFHVSDVFQYYNFKYFKSLFLATLLITILNMGITSVLDLSGIPVLGFLASLAVALLNALTVPLIIFSDYKALEAINTSFSLVSKQPLILLGLLAVTYLFCITGIFMFFIGFFFTLPFLYSMYYAIYKSIIDFN